MYRFAKIVATLGPSSSTEAVLVERVKAGMDVCRLNFHTGPTKTTRENQVDSQNLKVLANLFHSSGPPGPNYVSGLTGWGY
jgi:pyruvate kinase